MSDSLVPKICGKNDIYVPDDGCSECMRELLLFKDEVDVRLDEKQDTLIAGDNITIEGNTISVSGIPITKAQILATLGYEETTITMVSTDGTTVTETVLVKA